MLSLDICKIVLIIMYVKLTELLLKAIDLIYLFKHSTVVVDSLWILFIYIYFGNAYYVTLYINKFINFDC